MDFNIGLSVSSPWLMLLLFIIPLFIWYQYRYTSRLIGLRKHTAVLLRSIILLLIISLIAGVHPYTSVQQRNVAVVVDRSDSIGGDDQALDFLQALESKDEQNYLAIVSFAQNIMIDRALQPLQGQQPLSAFRTVVQADESNIAAALRQAGGLLNQSRGGKIVLLTDGMETSGSLLKEAQLLQAMNVTVDAVLLQSKVNKDAAVSSFKSPSQLKEGEKYQLAITVASTHQARAELLLYEDDALIAQQNVELVQGSNQYLLDAIAASPGMKQYRAVIRMEEDSEPRNNVGYSFSRVDGPAGVLIVEGEPGSSRNIEAALTASYIAYRTISPVELSYELAAYVQADAIIFNNVSAVDLPQIKMEHVEAAVRNYGVGFMMLGGSDSFGLGGYFDTPIEKILPVNMQLSGKKQIPDLQLMLVIDHSGSMQGAKMELAKEAAARTVELMRPVDMVGVIAFDTIPSWIVTPVKLSDRESVITSIMSIQPNGGTDIYPALASAYEGFDLEAAARRHIILLTDGISPYTPAYESLLNDLQSDNITLSTVAVGQDSDVNFLQTLAESGGGRAYYTEDESTLPAIFSREATLMSRAYIVEGDILPQEGYAGSWSQLWQDGVPNLQAYVATSAKSTAEVALWSPQEDPILARWNIGAGKSVAFMSDANGKWSSDWISWSEFPEVFTQWVRWTYPQFVQNRYSVEQDSQEGQGKLIITSNDGDSTSNLGMTIDTGEETKTIPLVPVASGKYEADVSELESGVYFTQIGELQQGSVEAGSDNEEQNGVRNGVTTGFIVPYSSEYRLDVDPQQAKQKLTMLVEMTGGRMLKADEAEAEAIYQFEPTTVRQSYDWSRQLLMLLLLLWLLDIANRRLSLPWRRWFARLLPTAGKQVPAASPATGSLSSSSAALQRLQKRKQHLADHAKLVRRESTDASKDIAENVQRRPNPQSSDHISSDKSANMSSNTARQKQATDDASKGAGDTMNRLLAAKNRKKQ